MAVLVGVLAPAYLKYVEKSRKSADLDTIDALMKAADTMVSDDDYSSIVLGTTLFEIGFDDAKITMGAGGNADALKDWQAVANVNGDPTLKSKTYKGESGKIKGQTQTKGSVYWYKDNLKKITSGNGADNLLKKLADSAPAS